MRSTTGQHVDALVKIEIHWLHTRWKLCPLIKFLSHSLSPLSCLFKSSYTKWSWEQPPNEGGKGRLEPFFAFFYTFLGHKCKNVNCLNSDQVALFDTLCSLVCTAYHIRQIYYVFIHVNLKGIFRCLWQKYEPFVIDWDKTL